MCVNFAVTGQEMGFRILINSSNSILGIVKKQIKNSQYGNGFYKNALETLCSVWSLHFKGKLEKTHTHNPNQHY